MVTLTTREYFSLQTMLKIIPRVRGQDSSLSKSPLFAFLWYLCSKPANMITVLRKLYCCVLCIR